MKNRIIAVSILVIVVFLAGFVPQYLAVKRLEKNAEKRNARNVGQQGTSRSAIASTEWGRRWRLNNLAPRVFWFSGKMRWMSGRTGEIPPFGRGFSRYEDLPIR